MVSHAYHVFRWIGHCSKLFHRWSPLPGKNWESDLFLPGNFPAVLIIFAWYIFHQHEDVLVNWPTRTSAWIVWIWNRLNRDAQIEAECGVSWGCSQGPVLHRFTPRQGLQMLKSLGLSRIFAFYNALGPHCPHCYQRRRNMCKQRFWATLTTHNLEALWLSNDEKVALTK